MKTINSNTAPEVPSEGRPNTAADGIYTCPVWWCNWSAKSFTELRDHYGSKFHRDSVWHSVSDQLEDTENVKH